MNRNTFFKTVVGGLLVKPLLKLVAKPEPAKLVFQYRDPLALAYAKSRGICRICRKSHLTGSKSGVFVMNYGAEFAHWDCLHPGQEYDFKHP